MKDIFDKEINRLDSIIVTVSRGSIYLTVAEVLDISETGNIYVTYQSTPKEKWINPAKEPVMVYNPPERKLYSGVGLFRDNAGYVIEPGDKVAWNSGFSISIGEIGSIVSDLWATLKDGTKVRNIQIIKLG